MQTKEKYFKTPKGRFENNLLSNHLIKFVAYRLNKIKKDEHYHYIEARSEIAVTKKFRKVEIAQEHLILIAYTTFWALLESYNSHYQKKITTKRLHRDFGRSLPVSFSYDGSTRILIREIEWFFGFKIILILNFSPENMRHRIFFDKFFPW